MKLLSRKGGSLLVESFKIAFGGKIGSFPVGIYEANQWEVNKVPVGKKEAPRCEGSKLQSGKE